MRYWLKWIVWVLRGRRCVRCGHPISGFEGGHGPYGLCWGDDNMRFREDEEKYIAPGWARHWVPRFRG
jgi:hypothetical protein